MKNIKKLLYITILFLFPFKFIKSEDGSLDMAFGSDGLVITDFSYAEVNSVKIQPDGRIVVAGWTEMGSNPPNFALARYNTNGSLDESFSKDGLAITEFDSSSIGNSLAIQSNGYIIVAGKVGALSSSQFALARYNSYGFLDKSFGSNGFVLTVFDGVGAIRSVEIQADNRIVVAGFTEFGSYFPNFTLARYNSDGSLDKSFGYNGLVVTSFGSLSIGTSIKIQPDNHIVIAGMTLKGSNPPNFALARYNTDGSLDKSFGQDGLVITDFGDSDFGLSVGIQTDGRIVIAGETAKGPNPRNFALARYNIYGTLDKTFGQDGLVITDFGQSDHGKSVAIQSDGQIVVAGYTFQGPNPPNFALARYNTDGSLDKSFGQDGLIITDFGYKDRGNSIAIQPNGYIIVAGATEEESDTPNFALARYITRQVLPELDYKNSLSNLTTFLMLLNSANSN